MKLDQIAYYCADGNTALRLKQELGFGNEGWVSDTVTGESFVFGQDTLQENVAQLQFNYKYGIEFEIIRYIKGPHWHKARNIAYMNKMFLSHVGFHLDDGEDFPSTDPGILVQETWTKSHTSAYLTTGAAAGRRYHYRIYELAPATYVKYIKRIHPHDVSA